MLQPRRTNDPSLIGPTQTSSSFLEGLKDYYQSKYGFPNTTTPATPASAGFQAPNFFVSGLTNIRNAPVLGNGLPTPPLGANSTPTTQPQIVPQIDDKELIPFATAGIDIGSQLIALMNGPEVETPRYNKLQSSALERMRERQVDLSPARQSILSGKDAQLDNIRDMRSVGAKRALSAAAYSRANQALAETDTRQQEINSQILAQLGQFEYQVGERDAAREREIDVANLQNEAMQLDLIRNLGNSIHEVGKFAENKRVNDMSNQSDVQLLNMLSKDFKFEAQADGSYKLIPR